MPKTTKQISLTYNIPSEYKWIAVCAWGETIAFKTKPKLIDDFCEGKIWANQEGELSICTDEVERADWKNSVRKI